MGTIFNAYCEKCGFKKEVFFGAGFHNFETECNVPAINKKTGKFVTKNIFMQDELKDKFIFYNDPSMYNGEIDDEEIQWGEISLKRNENLCPNCKSYSMNFIFGGCFD